MRFWDSSALVPLIVEEPSSSMVQAAYETDRILAVWTLSPVEVWSAVSRKRREGILRSPDMRLARARLQGLASDWTEVEKTKTVCIRASRLVEVHPLTSAAAIQLAAALVLVSDCPAGFEFVTLDERLGEIAEQEGFAIVGATPA